jgi:hypothetical protein
MEQNPNDANKCKSAKQSRNIDDTYILDPASGIYKPKTVVTQTEADRQHPGNNRNARFFTDPRTDWHPILRVTIPISLLTLLLLGATVIYTKRQWKTLNDTYSEIHKQTVAAQCTAKAAQEQAALMEKQLEGTMAARVYVVMGIRIDVPGELEPVIYNDGSVPAQDFQGSISVTAITVPGKKIVRTVAPMIVTIGSIVIPPSNHPPVLSQPTQPRYSLTISGTQVRDFRDGKYGFKVSGIVNYLNGISQTPQHIPICMVFFRDPEYPEANVDSATCDNLSLQFKSVQLRAEEDKKRTQKH